MVTLLVEDNRLSLRLLESIMIKNKYRVVCASNGREAVELLQKHQEITMVITDVNMPEMSGLDLIKIMKKNIIWRDIPIIVCSSVAEIETIKQAMKLGIKHYLVKPVDAYQLTQKVKQAGFTERTVLRDRQATMRKFDISIQEYSELCQKFLEEVTAAINSLQPVNDKFPEPSRLNLDSLHESAEQIGAERFADAITELKLRHQDGQGQEINERTAILLREMNVLAAELK